MVANSGECRESSALFSRLFSDLAGNSPRIDDPDRRVIGAISV